MASSKEFKEFVLEQLRNLSNIGCRPMMGEYLLYYNDILFGGIYDNRFLIKKTKSNAIFSLKEELPYKNGKPMFMIENIEDIDYVCSLVKVTYDDLKNNKKA